MEEEDLTTAGAPPLPLSPLAAPPPGSPPIAARAASRTVLTPLDLGELDVDAPLELGPQARSPWLSRAAFAAAANPERNGGFRPWAHAARALTRRTRRLRPCRQELLSHGVLPNGLNYYVRSNKKPAARAALALVIRVGSLAETEEERGVAHFVEVRAPPASTVLLLPPAHAVRP
jgi:hypothetical protein